METAKNHEPPYNPQEIREDLDELSQEVFHIMVDGEEGYKIDELPDILGSLITNHDELSQSSVKVYRFDPETAENIEPLKLFPDELEYLRQHPDQFIDLKMTLALSKSHPLKHLGISKEELDEFIDNF